jgi:hypothetical protein
VIPPNIKAMLKQGQTYDDVNPHDSMITSVRKLKKITSSAPKNFGSE